MRSGSDEMRDTHRGYGIPVALPDPPRERLALPGRGLAEPDETLRSQLAQLERGQLRQLRQLMTSKINQHNKDVDRGSRRC